MTEKQAAKWTAREGSSQLGRLRRRKAIERGEFIPYLQPLVEMRTGLVAGYEVLARWNHPEAGMLLPNEFIRQAETEGWVGDLMHSLLQQSFLFAQSLGRRTVLAISVSPMQFQDLTLPEQIGAAARRFDFSLDRLTIEITETPFLADRDRALLIARELKQIGCRLSLDDFGTGCSSLRTLQSLPFDEIKVDHSFVSSMQEHRESRKIVAAVIGLGQSLGITTVAEGVEKQEQADMLRWLGCDLGQGWLYGEPAPIDRLRAECSQPHSPESPAAKIYKPLSERYHDGTPSQRLSQLQAVYDGAPVALAFLDCNLRYRNLNQRLANFNGIPVEAHLGRFVAELRPDVFQKVQPYLQRALAGEAIHNVKLTFTNRVTNKEQRVSLSYQPTLDEANEVIGVSIAASELMQWDENEPLLTSAGRAAM